MAMSFSTKEYFVKETYKSIRRNGFMSFASISTVAVSLLVLGMFLLIFLNTNNLAQYLESQVQVRLGDQEQLLNSLGKDNPFPNSFEVQVDSPERIKVITPSIGQLPKVETAKFGQEVVEHLFSLTKILRFGGIVLVVFLAMATLFIISNTIRLTVFARRKEVVIMKYVGATDWFIRWPFLLEGMTLGFFGAVIASVCINSLYAGLLERIHATLAFLPLLPTSPLLFYVTIFLLAAGTGIGALGSYISLRKFLRV